MQPDTIGKAVVLILALGISALFLAMIQPFLMALLLAGIFAALGRPLYLRLTTLFGGRRALASATNLTLMTLVVLVPLVLLAGVLVSQAFDVAQLVSVWVKDAMARPESVTVMLERLPFYEQLAPHWGKLAQRAADATATLSGIAVSGLSSFTLGTVNFIFLLFVFLYSLYFLQMDGDRLIEKFLYYLPLKTSDERMMLEKFTSVTQATLRGSLLIGLVQGTLGGIALAVAGIPNAVFWGSVMAVMSTIPNLGTALVWAPASVILIAGGQVFNGVALAVFCALVVGSLDNVLRPILVGKDTKMHELMIFFGTLGGIFMFGFPGIFIGPVIASIFVSIWEIYGVEFADLLPQVEGLEAILGDPLPEPDREPDADHRSAAGDGPRDQPEVGPRSG